MSSTDFELLNRAVGIQLRPSDEVRERIIEQDKHEAKYEEQSVYHFDAADDLQGDCLPPTPDDRPCLASLVRALVSIHLRGVEINVFSNDPAIDYLGFSSYLSYLWYDFSTRLDVVCIRYCAHCGRPFSVVGNRGPEQKFCSRICKDSVKNGKSRWLSNEVRSSYMAGSSIQELAQKYYPDMSPRAGKRKVQSTLQTYPELKHALDDDIRDHGLSAPLLARCKHDELDMHSLLSVRSAARIRKLAAAAQQEKDVNKNI